MSQNQESGGGCLLFFIDWIIQIFRNRHIRRLNQQARGVSETPHTTSSAVFPLGTIRDNIIISGGSQGSRLSLSHQFLAGARNTNQPVIVIHTSNTSLENMVARRGLGVVASENSLVFDAFRSFEFDEIVSLVTETARTKYDIKPAGRYILQVVFELLQNQGHRPYYANFANVNLFRLNDYINAQLGSGSITQDTADRLHSLLVTGQQELPKLDVFFRESRAQMSFMMPRDPEGAVSVLSAIRDNQIFCIDIRSSANTMLLELIVNSLFIAMNRGYNFSLMVDDVPFSNNELLKNAICQRSNHRTILLSKDLYALTGGKEDIFSALIGEAEKTVLFAHNSSISCEKWSKYLGEYDKIDVSKNQNSGWGKSSRWGYQSNYGQMQRLQREHKIKPEQIRGLRANEAIIYDSATDSIIQTMIT